MTTLVLATRNAHKVREIREILGEQFGYRTLDDLPTAPVVVEDADTFAGNATKKAVALARWLAATPHSALRTPHSEGFVLADDSGLEVDDLEGAPGVHSARFAALDTAAHGNAPDADNNAKLLRLLQAVPVGRRTARFRCVIALVSVRGTAVPCPTSGRDIEPEAKAELFEGICEGEIGFEPRGRNGFGYDPLFVPTGFGQTFAELGDDVKNRLSHRARALAALRAGLESGGYSTRTR